MHDRAITVEEARALDRAAQERFFMPSLLLMENAARAVAAAARALGTRFLVLCGRGNNGGDGLAAARHLGRSARVHLLGEPHPERSPDAARQLRILRAAEHPIVVGEPPDVGDERWVWVDALFGTGLARPLEGPAAEWVRVFEAGRGPKLAVDVPSGLDGDRGEVLGIACHADVTVTFEAPKVGLLRGRGPEHAGLVKVAPLGIPRTD